MSPLFTSRRVSPHMRNDSQVLSSKGETRIPVTTVHTGLLTGRGRRGRFPQSHPARSPGAAGPRAGVPGRTRTRPERPVPAQPAAPVVVQVVRVAGKPNTRSSPALTYSPGCEDGVRDV